MTGLLLGLLLAQNVVAGGSISKTSVQAATTAALTFYVDPAGSNANTCTASGASGACATLAGALARVPNVLRHNVTINVAAGAYGVPFAVSGFQINSGVTLAITGTMSAVVPATGTASGTTTSAAGGSASGPANVTDSLQTWTTSNLVGKYINFTSGALAGQAFPITANTATVITFASNTSAGTGSTYTLIEPGSTFISTTGATLADCFGAGSLTVTSLHIERTSGVSMTATASIRSTLTNSTVKSASTAILQSGGLMVLTRSFADGLTGLNVTPSSSIATTYPSGIASNSFLRSTTGSAVQFATATSANSVTFSYLETASGIGLANFASYNTAASQNWVACTTSGIGIQAGRVLTAGGMSFASAAVSANTRVSGCTTGLLAYGKAQISVASITIANTTTGFSAVEGGIVDLRGSVPTFSTVTNETSLDGTVYTIAALDALGVPKIVTNNYGSRVIR